MVLFLFCWAFCREWSAADWIARRNGEVVREHPCKLLIVALEQRIPKRCILKMPSSLHTIISILFPV